MRKLRLVVKAAKLHLVEFENNSHVNDAVKYARRGHPVSLVNPGDDAPGDATTDVKTIRGWFRKHPYAGFRVRCDNLLVIDVRDIFAPWFVGNANLLYDSGAASRFTGRGVQFVFRQPSYGMWGSSVEGLGQYIDVRTGPEEYIDVDSKSPWDKGHSITDRKLPEPPKWLLNEILPNTTPDPECKLTMAIAYAAKGFFVFPCVPGDKTPLTLHGHKDASDNVDVIMKWWTDNPNANIGLVTEGLLVVDVDPIDGKPNPWPGDEHAASLAGVPSQATPRGGRHYFLRTPDGYQFRNTASKIAPKVDTRGDGGYVIVSPSVVNDKRYRWLPCHELQSRDDLPESPQWLIDLLIKRPGPAASTNGAEIPEGGRNATLTSLGGVVRNAGASVAEIRALLLATNEARCNPPLPDAEVIKIADSLGRYEPKLDVSQVDLTGFQGAGGTNGTGKTGTPAAPAIGDLGEVPGPGGTNGTGKTGTPAAPERAIGFLASERDADSPIEWVWLGRIPRGELTLLSAAPDAGKSIVVCDIVGRITSGAPWPDSPNVKREPADVIMLLSEDSIEKTVIPRLKAAKADLSRVYILTGVGKSEDKQSPFCVIGGHLQHLKTLIVDRPGTQVVVMDMLDELIGNIDANKKNEVLKAVRPLVTFAAKHNIAVIGTRHHRKALADTALNRGAGSVAWGGLSRASWAIVVDPDDPDRRLLVKTKMNIDRAAPTMAFRIEKNNEGRPEVQWEAELLPIRADDVMSDNPTKRGKRTRESGERPREECMAWLMEELANGPVESKFITEKAKVDGHAAGTLNRARKALGVKSKQQRTEGGDSFFVVFLPNDTREYVSK